MAAGLYRDNNMDGLYDAGDTGLKSTTCTADNGFFMFSGMTELIPAGQVKHYIVVYLFSATAPLGTYSIGIPSNSNIGGYGQTTGLPFNALASYPVNSNAVTLVAPTPTATGTFTRTSTPTSTMTVTDTPTFTRTVSPTNSATDTATGTFTMTPVPTSTYTATATDTQPPTKTITPTSTATQTFTAQPTPNTDRVLDKNVVDASKGEKLKIKFMTSAAGILVKMKAYNLSGEMVKKGEYTTPLPGWNEVEWDLKNDSGKMLGQGIYFIHIDAEGRTTIKKVYVIK
jgi:hypothetical protein